MATFSAQLLFMYHVVLNVETEDTFYDERHWPDGVELCAGCSVYTKAVSKPSYRQAQIINPDLVMVRAAPQKILLNKPIAVGFSVLELSKLSMYEFYYDYLKPKYQSRCKLLFTDTDSLCCQIQTPDIYQDMH